MAPKWQTPKTRAPESPAVLKEAPDHDDADLVLKIYDLRREPVMRESRTLINTSFGLAAPKRRSQ
jgi:hypothetical protein